MISDLLTSHVSGAQNTKEKDSGNDRDCPVDKVITASWPIHGNHTITKQKLASPHILRTKTTWSPSNLSGFPIANASCGQIFNVSQFEKLEETF